MHGRSCTVHIDGTVFEVNIASVGAGARMGGVDQATITRSHFIGNQGVPGPAALFRNPGMDDLRLLKGSPALDSGSNAWLPRDLLFDLDGLPRIQSGIVDMGCFEGVNDAVAQATSIPYIPPGGEVILVMKGAQPNLRTKRVVRVQNMTDESAGPTILTELPPADHPLRGTVNPESPSPAAAAGRTSQ